jgi:hypothetical protein
MDCRAALAETSGERQESNGSELRQITLLAVAAT